MHYKIQTAIIPFIQFYEMVTAAKRAKAPVCLLPVDMADTMEFFIRKFFRHVMGFFPNVETGWYVLPDHPV